MDFDVSMGKVGEKLIYEVEIYGFYEEDKNIDFRIIAYENGFCVKLKDLFEGERKEIYANAVVEDIEIRRYDKDLLIVIKCKD